MDERYHSHHAPPLDKGYVSRPIPRLQDRGIGHLKGAENNALKQPNIVEQKKTAARFKKHLSALFLWLQNATKPHHLQQKRPLASLILSASGVKLRLQPVHVYSKRLFIAAAALLVGTSVLLPLFSQHIQAQRYDLSPEAQKLVGPSVKSLLNNLKLNNQTGAYEYNADYKPDPSTVSIKAGQYRSTLATKDDHSVTVDDPVSNVILKFTPQFAVMDAKSVDGRIVYPITDSSAQLVYSLKGDGLKEDVVLPYYLGEQLFKYDLVLPAGTEAHLESNGDIGVYGGDPLLFGNISVGSQADQAKLDQARQNSAKTNLLFTIPAPIIKDKDGKIYSDKASFTLGPKETKQDASTNPNLPANVPGAVTNATNNHYQLTVQTKNLNTLSYPISVDPSIRVTSASDFRKGNNEGIDFDDTNNQILRPGLTGATVGSWAATPSLNTQRQLHSTATYNGCIYAISGENGASYITSVEYSVIGSNGVLGSWTTSGNSTLAAHVDGKAVAYNGYLYILAGAPGVTVEYTKINSDCSINAWTNTTAAPGTNMQSPSAAVYNGYIYLLGGWNGNLISPTLFSTIYYAQIKADGSLGSWTTSSVSLPEARRAHDSVVYNGNLYVVGGLLSGGSATTDVKYINIKSDGSLGAWTVTTSLPVGKSDEAVAVSNGYLYVTGGGNSAASTDVEYASIYTNGSVGSWVATTSFGTNRYEHTTAIYNGYLYVIAGATSGVSSIATGEYAKIDVAGSIGTYNHDTTHTLPTGSWGAGVTVYNGIIYVIGGCQAALAACESSSATDYLTSAYHTTINSDGTLNGWSTDTVLPTSETGIKAGRFGAGVVAYNGYVYVAKGDAHTTLNGQTQKSDVLYSKIRSDGVLINPGCGSTWCVAGTDTVAQGRMGTVVYNGWLYMIGGDGGAGGSGPNQGGDQTRIAQLKSDGTINGFSYPGPGGAAVTLDNKVLGLSAVVANGYIYVFGGRKSTGGAPGNYISTVESIQLNSDGTFNGSWSNVGDMPNIKAFESAVVNNGYVYIIGGVNKINTTFTIFSDTTFARLKSDGTLDTQTCSDGSTATWCTTKSMAAARFGAGGVVANGNVYEIGGCEGLNGSDNCNPSPSSNYAADTEYAPINNGGEGGFNWANGNNISSRGEHASVVVNGYVYVMGGCVSRNTGQCKGLTNNIQYALINADGTLGNWAANTTVPLPSGLMDFFAVAYNGRIYIGGGCNAVNTFSGGCTGSTTAINFVAPAANGDITANWTSNGNSPGTSNTPLIAYNGYMYNLGANATTNGLNYYAAINASTNSSCTGAAGLICSWSSTSSLNTPRGFHSAIYYGGYIYVVGGAVSNVAQNSIEYAKIDPNNHTLGTWTQVTTPWLGRQLPVLTAYDGYLCMVAGYNPSVGFLGDAWCTAVFANGGLGNWQQSSAGLSQGLATPGGAQSGGTFYVTGGENGGAGNDVVPNTYIGNLRAISRVGHFSRVFDMDKDVRPTKLIMAGTGLTDYGLSVSFRDATNSALTFDNQTGSLSSLAFNTNYDLVPTSTHSPARYNYLFFTLDDSLSAIFPDNPTATTSNATTISDFDFYFNANSTRRLRNGKTFINETVTGVDAQP